MKSLDEFKTESLKAMVKLFRIYRTDGIVIGVVAEESHLTALGYAEASVKLAVDPGQIDQVFVIMK